MGLDMEIRLVRKGFDIKRLDSLVAARADLDEDEVEIVADNIETLMEGNGRTEFAWLRNWVAARGDDTYDFYGKYITIDGNDAAELIDMALQNEENISYASYLPDIERGAGKAIAILSLWQLYDRLGWEMQVECDW